MNIVRNLIAGDDVRRSRFHTQGNEICGIGSLPGVIPSGLTWMRARLSGRYARKPWWVWQAIGFVERNLRGTDQVLEVGAGYSTLWLARRCGFVAAIEESPEWLDQISGEARREGIRNATLHAGPSLALFRTVLPSQRWDVVAIDGPRERLAVFMHLLREAATALPRMVIYDDTDRIENRPAFREGRRYEAFTFRGFKPQTLHACETTVFVRR